MKYTHTNPTFFKRSFWVIGKLQCMSAASMVALFLGLSFTLQAQTDSSGTSIFDDSLVQTQMATLAQDQQVYNFSIEEQSVVKYGQVSQVYFRFGALPPGGGVLELWQQGQASQSYALIDTNLLVEVPTDEQYEVRVNGTLVGNVDTRIMASPIETPVTVAMFRTMGFDDEFVAGNQSILSAMDENPEISFYEKLSLLQAHYLKGLPLGQSYYDAPSVAEQAGYFRDIESVIFDPIDPPHDPFCFGEGLDSIVMDVATDWRGNPPTFHMLGPGAPTTRENGTIINIGFNGQHIFLIARDGFWHTFDPSVDCQYSLQLLKTPYLTNVDLRSGVKTINTPYEHFDFIRRADDVHNSEDRSKGVFIQQYFGAVKGAAVNKFIKARAYPTGGFGSRDKPGNKTNEHGQLDPNQAKTMTYNLVSSNGWYAFPCACEKTVLAKFNYCGEFDVETILRRNRGTNYTHASSAHTSDNALAFVANLKTGNVQPVGAGFKEANISCMESLNPEWAENLNQAAVGYVESVFEIAKIVLAVKSGGAVKLDSLKTSAFTGFVSGLVGLYTTEKFVLNGHCGAKNYTYCIINDMTSFTLKPNEPIMVGLASGQKLQAKGTNHFESTARVKSRGSIATYFEPQGQASYPGGPTCCSRPYAQWIQTGADLNYESENLNQVQQYLGSMALWDSKFMGGALGTFLAYGHYGSIYGRLPINCTNPISLRTGTDLPKTFTVSQYQNRLEVAFPEDFMGQTLELVNMAGQTLRRLPIDQRSMQLDLSQLRIPSGTYLLGVKGKASYKKISKRF